MNAFWTISPILVSAHAVEGAGVNAIPETLADILAKQLNWRVDSGVVQTNIVAHTGADGFSRLARQAVFDGDVIPNEHYLLVDDFVGQGGTLANLRAHIIRGGGIVLGATVLTGKQHSANLALRDSTIEARADFQLELEFNTGETRIFDARPYLEKGIFRQLQDVTLFKQAYVAFDTVCWPGEIDIAPETLYDRSISVS